MCVPSKTAIIVRVLRVVVKLSVAIVLFLAAMSAY